MCTNRTHSTNELILPTSEYQIRSLAKLGSEQQVEIWEQAVQTNNGKIPTGKQIQKLVREEKAMKKASKTKEKLERFKCGDVVRINAKYNQDLRELHNHWGTIYSLEEFSYTVLTYKKTIKSVCHDDLRAIKQANGDETRLLLEQMIRLYQQYGDDSHFQSFLQFEATQPTPELSPVAQKIFDFLETRN